MILKWKAEITVEFLNKNRCIPGDEQSEASSKKSLKKKRNFSERFAFLKGKIDDVMSDNTMISVYPLGSNYFCFYESPFLQQVCVLIRFTSFNEPSYIRRVFSATYSSELLYAALAISDHT